MWNVENLASLKERKKSFLTIRLDMHLQSQFLNFTKHDKRLKKKKLINDMKQNKIIMQTVLKAVK